MMVITLNPNPKPNQGTMHSGVGSPEGD